MTACFKRHLYSYPHYFIIIRYGIKITILKSECGITFKVPCILKIHPDFRIIITWIRPRGYRGIIVQVMNVEIPQRHRGVF